MSPHTDIPRQPGDVMVEPWVREALIRLNPEIAAQPDRADEVIYKLRAILLSVQADGLVRANENFMAWLRGEKTMPFGHNGEHVPVRLVDAVEPANNRFTVTNQWTYQAGAVEKRFDVVFLVNGLPLVIGEAKTPTRSAVTWFDGAFQVNEIYEKQVPAMFVPNVFSFATEGKLLRYGSIRMPIEHVGAVARRRQPGRRPAAARPGHGRRACCGPRWCSTSCRTSPLFATDKKHRRIKIICRYQQYETTNKIVERVVAGLPEEGPDLAFPGQRQVAADGLRRAEAAAAPAARQPTVLIVVDRIDLDTQITATFNAADVPNMVGVATPQGAADAARRRTCARSSSPPSTSSARPAASSTTAQHHRDGGRGPPHPGRRPRAARCARRCRTPSCSASPARRSTAPTATPSGPSAPTRTRRAT